jgi:hypothetical protein
MAEPSRLRMILLVKMILLVIAMAQLATEVTRLVSAWQPAHISHEEQRSGQPGGYGFDPAGRDQETKRTKRPDLPGGREPPPYPRTYRPVPLHPDFSPNYRPSWCQACRQGVWLCERRYDGWYCDWYEDW